MNNYIITILIAKENRETFTVQKNNIYQAFLYAKTIQKIIKNKYNKETEIIGIDKE